MTLNTHFVLGAVESVEATAEQVYLECRRMLDTPEDVQPIREPSKYDDEKGLHRIDHPGGIGLAAWLMTP